MSEPVHVQEELVAFIDGELPEIDRSRVAEHLLSCADCRAERALLEGAIAASLRGPFLKPSPQLRRNVLDAIAAEPQGLLARWRRLLAPRFLVPAAALGAAALALAVASGREKPATLVEYAVADRLELLKDYDLVASAAAEGLSPEDLDVVAHLDELGD
jgi:anti-sigma factor RsiW